MTGNGLNPSYKNGFLTGKWCVYDIVLTTYYLYFSITRWGYSMARSPPGPMVLCFLFCSSQEKHHETCRVLSSCHPRNFRDPPGWYPNSSFFRIPSTHHNFPTLHQFSMVIPYHFCWISLDFYGNHKVVPPSYKLVYNPINYRYITTISPRLLELCSPT